MILYDYNHNQCYDYGKSINGFVKLYPDYVMNDILC